MRARLVALALLTALLPCPSAAWTRSPATTFAVLPAGAAHPEGITVDEAGNVYVTTFAVGGTPTGLGRLFVFSPGGRLLREVDVAGSSPLLLDLAFHPTTGDLLVIDFGNHQVLRVDPVTGLSSVFAVIPDDPATPGTPAPNVLTFDAAGNVYISDSFQGIVWRTGPTGGPPTQWVASELLRTAGVPPFGANGLAFNTAGTALFVANTGNDTVVRVPVNPDGTAGTPAVFVNSINGADGLVIDDHDRLWVAANQADEIVVLDPTGRVIAKLGDFEGIGPDGAPRGLRFPASLVRRGPFIYVTNLALDLRGFNPTFATVDSPWAAQVTTHTVARIRAAVPPVPGLP